jgi:uncharacterized protein (TIGR04255 family)
MKIPKRVKKCSIVDSVCEIRFESSLPAEIVPGMILGALNGSDIESLPVSQIPEAVRNINEQFKYAPLYKVKIDDLVIQFGGRVIAISSPIPYIGWDEFKPNIEKILKKAVDSGQIKKITRVARRTINFFPEDILDKTNFKVTTPIEIERKYYHYTDFYHDNDLMIRTTLTNQAFFQELQGSIIDIDAYIENNSDLNIEHLMNDIDKIHYESKKVFFYLLKQDFIDSMEPEYD